MTSVQSSLFSVLPLDSQIDVFDYVLSKEGNLGSRLVCKDWQQAVDATIKKRWQGLRATQWSFQFIEDLLSLHNQRSDDLNPLKLFRMLNEEWKKWGVAIPKGELRITLSYYAELPRKCIDQNLMKVWRRVQPQIYLYSHQIKEPNSVRAWIRYSRTKWVRAWVREIDLSRLELCFVPVEICAFSRLQKINLSHNRMGELPSFVGNLKDLKVLNLEENNLEELPEEFPSWTHLEKVNLNGNPLNDYGRAQVKQWKVNKAKPFRSKFSNSCGF